LDVLPFMPPRIKGALLGLAASFAEGAAGLRSLPHLARFAGFCLAVWACETTVIWLSARAFHIELAPWEAAFVLLAVALGGLVPASPGYVGTYEFFAVNALSLLGIRDAKALGCVLVVHVVAILTSTTVGSLCLLASYRIIGRPFGDFWRITRTGPEGRF
jgi:uncharacterized membrane protein YbhN (UPF0104 family)